MISELANSAIGFITDLIDANDTKEKWVKQTRENIHREYPSLNVVIYKDEAREYDFGGDDHVREFSYDLEIAAPFVEERFYILVSDNAGWFRRAGDAGWINWAFAAGEAFVWQREVDSPLVKFVKK